MIWPGKHEVLFALATCACGSVAESDPQFWEKTSDLGGKNFDFGARTGSTGASPGTGGIQTDPIPGSGGVVSAGGSADAGGLVGAGGAAGAGGISSGGSFGPGGLVGAGGVPESGGVTGSGGGAVVPGGPCKFSFSVTTVTARGRYAPSNVGAIWISDSQGKLVKALEVWGLRRLSNATAWQTASASGARVDVVTAATRPSHGAHNVTWDCLDPSKNPVPGGSYVAHVTFAESDAFPFFGPPPIEASVPFQRGAAPVTADGTDTANFKSMHVSVE